PWSVRVAMERFGDDINPGDVIIINDPYSGGTHLNDIAIIMPVFIDDKLAMIPAIRAHWADVGGMTPGSLSGTSTEIFQEGVRIPPIKIYERGKPVRGVLDLMFANMRVESERRGDLQAMLETCRTAEARIVEMVEKFSLDTLFEATELLIDRAELRLRNLIRDIPDGDYVFEDYLDASGNSPDPVLLKTRLTIEDGSIKVDFTGSSPQVSGPINASLAVTTTAVFAIIKTVLDPDNPINHGAFRPIDVSAPLGTILNAAFPAPCGGFAEIRRRTQSVVMGALSQALPKAIAGDVKGSANHCYIGGFSEKTGNHFIFYEYPAGGTGGYFERDGSSAFRSFDEGDFSSIQPVEAIENEFPVIIDRCALRTDSGGPGWNRGGLGIEREVRLTASTASYSVLSDRCILPPFGIHQGGSGSPNSFTYRRDGTEHQPGAIPGKATAAKLVEGDVVIMRSAGGGGYGDPLTREPARVLNDITLGYVTIDKARNEYGVILSDPETVDVAATEALRKDIAAQRCILAILDTSKWSGDEYAEGRRWVGINQQAATKHGIVDRAALEIVLTTGAPLRAWARIDGKLPEGGIWLGEQGAKMLNVDTGDQVW
ncbi:hypothetical protein LCGC14_2253170, partial [marine sediment metagenome]